MHKLFPAVVEVYYKGDTLFFTFMLHLSDDINSRRIDEEFYIKWSVDHKIPTGEHYEIQISYPDPIKQKCVHFYESKKDEAGLYVCWTKHVPDIKTALNIIKLWSAGNIYYREFGVDFITIFTEEDLANSVFDNGFKILAEEYGITVKVIYPAIE